MISIKFLIPSPPILDIVVRDYYTASPSLDGIIQYEIKNTNQYKVAIYSVGYKFNWEEHNPEGQEFKPIPPRSVIPVGEETPSPKEIVLNSAGNKDDSILQKVTFKSPPQKGSYTLEIIVETDKGEVKKEVKIHVEENN